MKRPAQIVLLTAARFYMPIVTLFACALLALRPAGSGVGLAAGLAAALMLALHMLVFGAEAARAAAPPFLSRCVLVLGLSASAIGAGLPRWAFAAHMVEGGVFAATAAGIALIIAAIAGRAPSLRDEDW
jgi:multisubunit Na+/H+ antiporter MnhB subunit